MLYEKEMESNCLFFDHKQLLKHFKSIPSYNAYAIAMLISIVQSEAFLSQAESHQIMWAATVNWKGGKSRNIEIDLLQENRNKDLKNLIIAMGANNEVQVAVQVAVQVHFKLPFCKSIHETRT